MTKTTERCFACGRPLGRNPALVDTRDDQLVYVGRDCYAKVVNASEAGYQPPRGGPRLFPLSDRSEAMKVWNIYRNGAHAGTVRAKNAAQAVTEYAAWAKCPESELSASA